MSLINRMNVGNTDYDIQDRLMPDAIGQAGQVLKVKDDGSGLEFSTIESGGKLYQHFVEMNHSAYGYSAIIFKSYRPTGYTLSDLVNYIKTFPNSKMIVRFKENNNAFSYPFVAYLECPGNYIEVWYSSKIAGYGSNCNNSKHGTEITSDTVTEL